MPSTKRKLFGALLSLISSVSMALPAVTVDSGLLQGTRHDNVDRYLGIPFAQPPINHLRWKAPRRPKAWSGSYAATIFGNICPQIGNYYASNNASTFGKPVGSEDCLYMNIWTPSHAPVALPVVVFIHGGAGVYGAASLPLYNGARLADTLQAVVVSFNYRLGILGGLHSSILGGDTLADRSGNFALLDQIEALNWVQRNISAFSGSPDNVTVLGHSAGCVSTWSLMQSPLARSLFHKAICLSGIPLSSSPEERQTRYNTFLHRAQSIRKLPIDRPLSPSEQRDFLYSLSSAEITLAGKGLKALSGPRDGHVISASPQALINPVPAIIGSVTNEASLLIEPAMLKLDRQQLWRNIAVDPSQLSRRSLIPSLSKAWLYQFAVSRANRTLVDRVNHSAAWLTQHNVPVYRYRFDWEPIPQPWKWAFGSFHGVDLPFVFGNFRQDTQSFTDFAFTSASAAQQLRIHQILTLSLKGFIESGTPNKYLPRVAWPEYGQSRTAQDIR